MVWIPLYHVPATLIIVWTTSNIYNTLYIISTLNYNAICFTLIFSKSALSNMSRYYRYLDIVMIARVILITNRNCDIKMNSKSEFHQPLCMRVTPTNQVSDNSRRPAGSWQSLIFIAELFLFLNLLASNCSERELIHLKCHTFMSRNYHSIITSIDKGA